jgi:hypothetical protein
MILYELLHVIMTEMLTNNYNIRCYLIVEPYNFYYYLQDVIARLCFYNRILMPVWIIY